MQHCRVCLQRTWILTEAGSDVPTLFLPRHCRVLLLLTDTLLIVKLVSLTRSLYILSQTDHWYPKMTSGFDFNTLHLTVNCSPRPTFSKLLPLVYLMCYTNELSSKQMSLSKAFSTYIKCSKMWYC